MKDEAMVENNAKSKIWHSSDHSNKLLQPIALPSKHT
jgi:hypothetical protein